MQKPRLNPIPTTIAFEYVANCLLLLDEACQTKDLCFEQYKQGTELRKRRKRKLNPEISDSIQSNDCLFAKLAVGNLNSFVNFKLLLLTFFPLACLSPLPYSSWFGFK